VEGGKKERAYKQYLIYHPILLYPHGNAKKGEEGGGTLRKKRDMYHVVRVSHIFSTRRKKGEKKNLTKKKREKLNAENDHFYIFPETAPINPGQGERGQREGSVHGTNVILSTHTSDRKE